MMTDLEEEVLFQLSKQRTAMSAVALADDIAVAMRRVIPLAAIYQTLRQSGEKGLVEVVTSSPRKGYRITAAGITALQHEWNYQREQLRHHA